MGKNHKKLINNLEQIRRSADLTQQELSVNAEVSRKSINAIENGVYVPSTVLALKIAQCLKCKVEDLFKLPQNWLMFQNKKPQQDVEVKNVKSRFLLYKNDFKFQLGFKVVVKKGTNKIKSSLQTIDFQDDIVDFKIKNTFK